MLNWGFRSRSTSCSSSFFLRKLVLQVFYISYLPISVFTYVLCRAGSSLSRPKIYLFPFTFCLFLLCSGVKIEICVRSSQRPGYDSRSSLNFFRFVYNSLSCSFNCEDYIPLISLSAVQFFHIYISNRKKSDSFSFLYFIKRFFFE